MSRYNFYFDEKNRKIICTSHYAGKVVRGTAKCHPNDKFNVAVGKELAQRRCDKKVEERRLMALYDKEQHLVDQIEILEHRLKKTRTYMVETANKLIELNEENFEA